MSQKIAIDAFDRKILGELLQNSRQSSTSLAKKVHLKRESVDYRIKKLINLGVIRDFTAEFDLKALGIEHYVFFAQLVRLKGDAEKRILDYLKNHKYISWIGTAAGKWSLVFDIFCPKQKELSSIIGDLLLNFGEHLEHYQVLKLEKGEYYFEKYLGISHILRVSKKTKPYDLDALDFKILSLLNRNSRINYAELSSKLHMTANGIKRRIKGLEKSGIIQKYSVTLDFKKFGLEWYGLQLKLNKFDSDTLRRIQSFLRSHPNIAFFYKYLGPWDFDVGFLAKNPSELRVFINELRNKFSEELRIMDVFITLDEIKGYQLPEGVFNY